MTAEPAEPGWKFWLHWVVATMLGLFVGAVAGGIAEAITIRITGTDLGDSVIGAGIGLGIGVCQLWVLRRHRFVMRAWVWASLAGHGLGFLARNALIPVVGLDAVKWIGNIPPGFTVGVAQWYILRSRVQQAAWWIPITVIAYGVGWSLGETGNVVIALIGNLFEAGTRGASLVWLLRRYRGPDSVPAAATPV